jgi:hypothetical protein
MADPTKPLRSLIRKYFTQQTTKNQSARASDTTRKQTHRNRHKTPTQPSERFVWGMLTLITALIGLIILEATHIIITRQVNSEMITIISGLIGSLATAFLLGKKHD